ncbi:MAG: hypothetical protein HY671_01680 [Chloroflexi bacterium]|nr:hypothetical protein [Chloroflexota bacterium]
MTSDDLRRLIRDKEKVIRDQIDDYTDTVYAILGFCSMWLFDPATRADRPNVKVFQGRHLSPRGNEAQAVVTPDLGIVMREETGILGEVKKNFPRDGELRKKDIFDQLKSYDQQMTGWPTQDEQLRRHDIALLVHQTTSRSASDYLAAETRAGRLKFDRSLGIFEFNRSDQRIPYFFFRLVEGQASEVLGTIDVRQGVQVPMQALLESYSRSKLYDAKPPQPYLLHLIWENVVVPIASQDERFSRLRRNQTIEVSLTVEDIVERLHESFSFLHWHRGYPNRQPHIPKSEWIGEACQAMVDVGEAKWVTGGSQVVVSYRKYDDVLKHFVDSQAELEAKSDQQPRLFNNNG